ncbi:MAG: pantetheine-phosphate adenylyltransferase [SAR202 cluster bacterium]|nr:pantetheine-phosphate adenylyltransferase [SAR202 cluster bacterium]
MATAVYPGRFDPVHNGHVDIATRASKLFDKLTISVYDLPPQRSMFSTEERLSFFRQSVAALPNVEVIAFTGLATDFASKKGATFIVRGLRAGNDFETESEMALMWRTLNPNVDVVCILSSLQNQFVHSSRIKEVAQLGGDVKSLVPPQVYRELKARFKTAQ